MAERWGRDKLLTAAMLVMLVAATATAGELRDPTRPPGAAPRAVGSATVAEAERRLPLLTATLVAPERRLAVIDGQTVIEGGTIGGAQLLHVGAEMAILRQGGREFTVRLTAPDKIGFRKTAREDNP